MNISLEYGVNEKVEGRIFHVYFDNCLFIAHRSQARISSVNNSIEFITWQKLGNRKELERIILSLSALGGLIPNPSLIQFEKYEGWEFQNPTNGDTLLIVASGAIITE